MKVDVKKDKRKECFMIHQILKSDLIDLKMLIVSSLHITSNLNLKITFQV
jgi:predicted transcriptional regulator